MPSASMSSRLEDTSAILGEYMLKGWTLTDLHCDTCHTTPLMREPAGSASAAGRDRIQFCASCDGSPAGRSTPATQPSQISAPVQAQIGESSKPAAAVADPSQSISTLLLQGYCLLGDNCPNGSCRGIPLVGYPKKKDGSKDGRKMCVSCGGRWVDGNDLGGMTLHSGPSNDKSGGGGMFGGGESPRSKARREMYGLSGTSATGPVDSIKGKEPASSHVKPGDEEEYDIESDEAYLKDIQNKQSTKPSTSTTTPQTSSSATSDPALSAALSHTSSSLAKTLERIASSLDRHTEDSREEGRYFVDVKLHTEAIKDVINVMDMVRSFKP